MPGKTKNVVGIKMRGGGKVNKMRGGGKVMPMMKGGGKVTKKGKKKSVVKKKRG